VIGGDSSSPVRPIGRDRLSRMTTSSLYFVNWWTDTLVIGGLSIVTWVALLAFHHSADTQPIFWFALVLSLVVNYPHFSATVYRLYQSPDNIRQFPVTAWGLPLILFGAVGASFWQPDVIAPYFLMLFLLWSPYHYSGQTIGLTMVYARRAGFSIGRRERMALSAFVFSAFVCGVIRFQQTGSSGGFTNFYGMSVPAFPLPDWMDAATQAVMWTGALVFAGFAFIWCLEQKRLMPPIVLLPALAHFVWFVPGASLKSFWIVIPFFHSLQYLLIALVMQLRVRIDVVGGEHSWRRVGVEARRWGSRNILGGILLFIGLPAAVSWLSLPLMTTVGILAAAVNIHHFFVDGIIWKLRDAATSSALMMNIAEFAGPGAVDLVRPNVVEA
jgi:hypothetical protein